MMHYIVTIQRQFGSMGRPIAKKMAELLGISFYDRDIVEAAAKKLDIPVSVVREEEERAQSITPNPFVRMCLGRHFRRPEKCHPLHRGTGILHHRRALRRFHSERHDGQLPHLHLCAV